MDTVHHVRERHETKDSQALLRTWGRIGLFIVLVCCLGICHPISLVLNPRNDIRVCGNLSGSLVLRFGLIQYYSPKQDPLYSMEVGGCYHPRDGAGTLQST